MLSVMKLNKENDRKNNKIIQTTIPMHFPRSKMVKKVCKEEEEAIENFIP